MADPVGVDALRAEYNEPGKVRHYGHDPRMLAVLDELVAARRRLVDTTTALRKYGQHLDGCYSTRGWAPRCSCGLAAALAAVAPAPPTPTERCEYMWWENDARCTQPAGHDGAHVYDPVAAAPPTEPTGRCKGTLGSRPWWMGVDQYDPCRCELDAGHEGAHWCEHLDAPRPVTPPPAAGPEETT